MNITEKGQQLFLVGETGKGMDVRTQFSGNFVAKMLDEEGRVPR